MGRTIHLGPDGAGDRPSLRAALDDAEQDDVIELAPGRYRLDCDFGLAGRLTVKGAGHERTIVEGVTEDDWLWVNAPGLLRLEGLSLLRSSPPDGTAAADVVVSFGGSIEIAGCRIEGGSEVDDKGGAGVRFGGRGGFVRDSILANCSLAGVVVHPEASCGIEGCELAGSTYGAVFTFGSRGRVARSTVRGNGSVGVLIKGPGVEIEDTIVEENRGAGIGLEHRAEVKIRAATCRGNGIGIGVYESSRADIERCVCEGNRDGVDFDGAAGGTLRACRVIANTDRGVVVQGEASPTLEDNVCESNASGGIAYFGSGAGTARRNCCAKNGIVGIYLSDSARPILEGNVVRDNARYGIYLRLDAAPELRDNDVAAHPEGAVHREPASAAPTTRERSVPALCGRLEAWLQANRPEYLAILRPGASEAHVAGIERQIGLSVPAGLKQFLAWRDGMEDDNYDRLQPGWEIMSADQIAGEHALITELLEQGTFDHENWWNSRWIPFLRNGGGDNLCIDLEGCFGGTPGQILAFLHDERDRDIEYASFEDWLETYVVGLERGLFATDDDDEFECTDDETWEALRTAMCPGYPRPAKAGDVDEDEDDEDEDSDEDE